MDKKTTIKKFKEVEKELLKLLRNSAVKISENDSDDDVKQNIKKHIETLKEVRVLFDEYEHLAKQIQSYDDGDDSQSSLEVSDELMQYIQENTKKEKIKKVSRKSLKQKNNAIGKDVDLSTNFSK